ncbi:Alpha/Beta hydrolase protein [Panaeolus papilionaceus]|nr:Alpha/Beta hydrolase protein [Panaeolus papilionaceus]
MPTVDLYSGTDYASIYYTTNTPYNNVGAFDPEKPTIIILHPLFLDSSWLDLQMGDFRLNKRYNMVAFDMRCCGRSVSRPTGRHDTWVEAADLAFCAQKLHLPPSHILALEGISTSCALRFAVLFPEYCLSLTLVNVPAPVELKWIYKNLDELMHASSFAEDLGSFEKAAFECIEFLFGPDSDPDLVDELISFWGEMYPPSKRPRIAEMTSAYINRSAIGPETYASITQPVLIIQGEKNELCPMKYAEKLVSFLTGVKDGPILYTVKGGTTMLSVVPGNASTVNKVFSSFLARLPHHRSEIVPPEVSIEDRMRMALRRLSELHGDPEMAYHDPLCSLSFSCLTPEVTKSQSVLLRHYRKNSQTAFNPTNLDDHVYRRYSQRLEDEHWSDEERHGTSITGHTKQESERGERLSSQSDNSPADSPLLRMAFLTTAEKPNTKGSIVRSIGSAQTASLHRLLSP